MREELHARRLARRSPKQGARCSGFIDAGAGTAQRFLQAGQLGKEVKERHCRSDLDRSQDDGRQEHQSAQAKNGRSAAAAQILRRRES